MKNILIKSAAALGLALAAASTAAPALADWDDHDGWRAREWREHEWREHQWEAQQEWRTRQEWRAHEWREHHRGWYGYGPYGYGYYDGPVVYRRGYYADPHIAIGVRF